MTELETETRLDLDRLPDHVLVRIIAMLPQWDVARFCCLSTTFHRLGNEVVRKRWGQVWSWLDHLMDQLKEEICRCPGTMAGTINRALLYRSYSACEFLRSEMSSTRAMGRTLLTSRDMAFNFGRIMDEYIVLYDKAAGRELPPWQVNDWLTLNIWKMSRQFMQVKGLYSGGPFLPTKLLDLLDSLIVKEFSLQIELHQQDKLHITADYQLHAQYMSRPPDVGEESGPLDEEAQRHLVEYLWNVIKVNNRIVLREEQYLREMEVGNRRGEVLVEPGHLDSVVPSPLLSLSPRNYRPPVPIPVNSPSSHHRRQGGGTGEQISVWIPHESRMTVPSHQSVQAPQGAQFLPGVDSEDGDGESVLAMTEPVAGPSRDQGSSFLETSTTDSDSGRFEPVAHSRLADDSAGPSGVQDFSGRSHDTSVSSSEELEHPKFPSPASGGSVMSSTAIRIESAGYSDRRTVLNKG